MNYSKYKVKKFISFGKIKIFTTLYSKWEIVKNKIYIRNCEVKKGQILYIIDRMY